MSRSQRSKRPVTVMATSSAAAAGTATYALAPRYSAPSAIPTNSVAMVRKLRTNRPDTEYVPQTRPKRSKMSRAWPTPVTAPRRTLISWLTMLLLSPSGGQRVSRPTATSWKRGCTGASLEILRPLM